MVTLRRWTTQIPPHRLSRGYAIKTQRPHARVAPLRLTHEGADGGPPGAIAIATRRCPHFAVGIFVEIVLKRPWTRSRGGATLPFILAGSVLAAVIGWMPCPVCSPVHTSGVFRPRQRCSFDTRSETAGDGKTAPIVRELDTLCLRGWRLRAPGVQISAPCTANQGPSGTTGRRARHRVISTQPRPRRRT
jgi:hypothetical protein